VRTDLTAAKVLQLRQGVETLTLLDLSIPQRELVDGKINRRFLIALKNLFRLPVGK
jgi:hypothetical protein